MLTIGSILFLILALLLGIIVLLFCDSYKKSPDNSAVRSLFLTFLFVFAYASVLAVFSIFFVNQPIYLAWGYNLGILLGLLAIFYSLQLPIFTANYRIQKYLPTSTWVVAILIMIILAIQIVDFRIPLVNQNGVIFWNLNPIAAWLTSSLILVFCACWAYLAYNSAQLLENFRLRWKMYILGINWIALGLSAFIFFPSASEIQSLISFFLVAPAYIATIIIFLYFRLVPEKA